MNSNTPNNSQPRLSGKAKAGLVITALILAFMLFDGVIKLISPPFVTEINARLGYSSGVIFGIGILEILCTLVYVIPRTAVFGAILLTGYLGGATATHVRIGDPFFFPVFIGVLVWTSIYLRDDRLRELVPLRTQSVTGSKAYSEGMNHRRML